MDSCGFNCRCRERRLLLALAAGRVRIACCLRNASRFLKARLPPCWRWLRNFKHNWPRPRRTREILPSLLPAISSSRRGRTVQRKRNRGGQPGHARQERPLFVPDETDQRVDDTLSYCPDSDGRARRRCWSMCWARSSRESSAAITSMPTTNTWPIATCWCRSVWPTCCATCGFWSSTATPSLVANPTTHHAKIGSKPQCLLGARVTRQASPNSGGTPDSGGVQGGQLAVPVGASLL